MRSLSILEYSFLKDTTICYDRQIDEECLESDEDLIWQLVNRNLLSIDFEDNLIPTDLGRLALRVSISQR